MMACYPQHLLDLATDMEAKRASALAACMTQSSPESIVAYHLANRALMAVENAFRDALDAYMAEQAGEKS